ncbi:FAD-dependent monooxygenase [Kineosporia sp. NBRC 101731]|uniref:FAD-dependent monooxygenase n=1 Tax=Kineosporia sp. NBRC 101731 TaxID=3032199 RepID=UPI002555A317|nr:FAD-dependent monooxygenase [Kineosporia sp. NBRC 101731]
MTRRRALIAGGGLGGLTAAAALHRRGWDVCVFEQAITLEPVAAGISVWPNGLRSLDRLGIGDAVREIGRVPGPGGLRQPDGTWLIRNNISAAVQEKYGDPVVALHRAELANVIVQALPFGVVQADTRVTGVRAGDADTPAALITEHGESEGDLVVAADGIRSVVRSLLFPSPVAPAPVGYTSWRMVVPDPGGLSPEDTGFETWGPDGRRFAVMPLKDQSLYCYATAASDGGAGDDRDDRDDGDNETGSSGVQELRRLFGDWHDPIPALLENLVEEQVMRHPVEELNPGPSAFHQGRVALIGDAAHAMTPDLGQGGSMALEDAVVLASLVGEGRVGPEFENVPIPPALEKFTQVRQARTQMVARRSRQLGRLNSAAPHRAQVLTAQVLNALPGTPLASGLASIVNWEPPPLPPADPRSRL